MEAAPFTLKVRRLKADVMEILMYGCVAWPLGKKQFAELRTAHHRFLLRIIGFQCLPFSLREDFTTFFPRRLASNCVYQRCNRRSRQLVTFRNKKFRTEISNA